VFEDNARLSVGPLPTKITVFNIYITYTTRTLQYAMLKLFNRVARYTGIFRLSNFKGGKCAKYHL
jgi:hypothetical protein